MMMATNRTETTKTPAEIECYRYGAEQARHDMRSRGYDRAKTWLERNAGAYNESWVAGYRDAIEEEED